MMTEQNEALEALKMAAQMKGTAEERAVWPRREAMIDTALWAVRLPLIIYGMILYPDVPGIVLIAAVVLITLPALWLRAHRRRVTGVMPVIRASDLGVALVYIALVVGAVLSVTRLGWMWGPAAVTLLIAPIYYWRRRSGRIM